jgi:hypothetical protein
MPSFVSYGSWQLVGIGRDALGLHGGKPRNILVERRPQARLIPVNVRLADAPGILPDYVIQKFHQLPPRTSVFIEIPVE